MAQRRFQLIALVTLATAVLSGCSALPANQQIPRPADYPVSGPEHRERVMNPASVSLLEQSRQQQRSGNLAQAGSTLERAVRIDPSEPAVWLALAQLRYEESNWNQTEQLARKAYSLAADGSAERRAAQSLIADALDRQGRSEEAQRLREELRATPQ
ncbi:MAG: hypothetical protein RIA65_12830 [Woeseia sp.]